MKYIIKVFGRAVWVMSIKASDLGVSKYNVSYTSIKQSAKLFTGRSDTQSTIDLLEADKKLLKFEIDTI